MYIFKKLNQSSREHFSREFTFIEMKPSAGAGWSVTDPTLLNCDVLSKLKQKLT